MTMDEDQPQSADNRTSAEALAEARGHVADAIGHAEGVGRSIQWAARALRGVDDRDADAMLTRLIMLDGAVGDLLGDLREIERGD
jgi:hypothetical protein